MKVFKDDREIKRVIFNIDSELAERLENAKEQARKFGKKLDVDEAINKTLEKFLKKAEKKLQELHEHTLHMEIGGKHKDDGKAVREDFALGPALDSEDETPPDNDTNNTQE